MLASQRAAKGKQDRFNTCIVKNQFYNANAKPKLNHSKRKTISCILLTKDMIT